MHRWLNYNPVILVCQSLAASYFILAFPAGLVRPCCWASDRTITRLFLDVNTLFILGFDYPIIWPALYIGGTLRLASRLVSGLPPVWLCMSCDRLQIILRQSAFQSMRYVTDTALPRYHPFPSFHLPSYCLLYPSLCRLASMDGLSILYIIPGLPLSHNFLALRLVDPSFYLAALRLPGLTHPLYIVYQNSQAIDFKGIPIFRITWNFK